MSESGCRDLGGTCTAFSLCGCLMRWFLVFDSLTLAVLVVSVCTSHCLQAELGTHQFKDPMVVRVVAAVRRSDKQPF